MKKILIAYDGSPGAEAAMLDMTRAGFPEKAEARVVSIADVWLPPEPSPSEPVLPDRTAGSQVRVRGNALEVVADAKKLAEQGAKTVQQFFPLWIVSSTAQADSPAWGISAEARKWNADLIVIGSHGRSPLEKFFLGSVSHKVAAEAPCSVRVYRQHPKSTDGVPRIIIGVDGSQDSNAAVEEALARDWPENSKFQLVTIVDQKVKAAAIFDAGVLPDNHVREGEDDWVAPMLTERAARFTRRGFEASTSILEGEPKSQLLRLAKSWDADCIFLGARGLQHGNRLYLGTFASAVASRADCPVEIVRPGGDRGAMK